MVDILDFLSEVEHSTAQSRRRTLKLDDEGRLGLERPLPFLLIYRHPSEDDPGTERLVTNEAAFLTGKATNSTKTLRQVVQQVLELSQHQFGGFLTLEVWSRPPEHSPVSPPDTPGFRIFSTPAGPTRDKFLDLLEQQLSSVRFRQKSAVIERITSAKEFPHRRKPLLSAQEARDSGLLQVGIEIEPYYQTPDRSQLYPTAWRALRRSFSRAIRHALYFFLNAETRYNAQSYHSLGRRAFSKVVWEVDEQLSQVASSFDFLLYINPANTSKVWNEFKRTQFDQLPRLRYRLMPVEPDLLKRTLYNIPVESVDDPTLLDLFSQKRRELETRLTMLADRGTPRFLAGSLQLYGRIDPALVKLSERILESTPPETRQHQKLMKPSEFADLAAQELAHYRTHWPEITSEVRMNEHVAGMMVSRGDLLVSPGARILATRADALIQHEVGTHIVTYLNARVQKLSLLQSGLAGYAALQEGMAVLSEYLVGGLTPTRLRMLAGRVLACQTVTDGADFIETFRLLCRYGFLRRAAFDITIRVHRGSGLTKDFIYLQGLRDLLSYLQEGGEFERLFVGKLSARQIPLIEELLARQIVSPPRLLPSYLSREECQQRLAELREGVEIPELLNSPD